MAEKGDHGEEHSQRYRRSHADGHAPASATGVTGMGGLATLSFVAMGKGTGTVSVTEAGLKNTQLQALPATLGSVTVTVQ